MVFDNRKPPVVMRTGKTARDKERGAWARRLTNQETRGNWDRQINEKGGKRDEFPVDVCNGTDTRRLRAANKRRPKSKGTGGLIRGKA